MGKTPPCHQEMTMTTCETESQNDGQVLTWTREFPISQSFMKAETIARLMCCFSCFSSNLIGLCSPPPFLSSVAVGRQVWIQYSTMKCSAGVPPEPSTSSWLDKVPVSPLEAGAQCQHVMPSFPQLAYLWDASI